jgi:redox-sensitive bicupin YhaK (pirin superfamily)
MNDHTIATAAAAGRSDPLRAPAPAAQPEAARRIVLRTRGAGAGPITRLASPGDRGELIKPFVFLDWFEIDPAPVMPGVGLHPHSGIATITTLLSGSVRYADSTGKTGVIEAGGVEWMQAGNGVWHTGQPIGPEPVSGFQLWVALPPHLENAPAESRYLPRSAVPEDGPVRVILGTYGSACSSLDASEAMHYFHISLRDGEQLRYQPPASHQVAWVAVHAGRLAASGQELGRELAIFAAGSEAIDLVARGTTGFVLGSAPQHPHPLVLGSHSVHTSRAALASGAAEIRRIGSSLRMADA